MCDRARPSRQEQLATSRALHDEDKRAAQQRLDKAVSEHREHGNSLEERYARRVRRAIRQSLSHSMRSTRVFRQRIAELEASLAQLDRDKRAAYAASARIRAAVR